MANAIKSPDDRLIDALKKAYRALPDTALLFGPGALFATEDADIAQRAIEAGYIIKHSVERPEAGRMAQPKRIEMAKLTDNGIRSVLEAECPKSSVEALLPLVQSLGRSSSPSPAAHACIADSLLARRAGGTMNRFLISHLPHHLSAATRWDDLEAVLTDWRFLEAKAEAGMIFDLAEDFAVAVRLLPADRPWHPSVRLMHEALRFDLQFIAHHPTTLFQFLWNTCWWYDCPDAANHYDDPAGGWPSEGPPWQRPDPKLWEWMATWRAAKEQNNPGFVWVRSLRPLHFNLGGKQRAVFRGHEKKVNCVVWSPDGDRLASGSHDYTVRLWDTATGRQLACLYGHEREVNGVAWSPDGSRLASASGGADKEEILANLNWRDREVLEFSTDFVQDNTVRVWDAGSGQQLACLCGHEQTVLSVVWSLDGRRLASASEDQTVRVWDTASGNCIEVITGTADAHAALGRERKEWYSAWQVVRRNDETAIESAKSEQPIAFISTQLNCVTIHPAGRMWAGRTGSDLCIFVVEGNG